jgi:hypothetical protein
VAGACPTQSSRTDCTLGLPLSTTSVFTARAWASTVCANVSVAIPARTRTSAPGRDQDCRGRPRRPSNGSARDCSGFRAPVGSATGPRSHSQTAPRARRPDRCLACGCSTADRTTVRCPRRMEGQGDGVIENDRFRQPSRTSTRGLEPRVAGSRRSGCRSGRPVIHNSRALPDAIPCAKGSSQRDA